MNNKDLIATPHIKVRKNQVSKIVIMSGDPLRAKYIADNYLQEVEQINTIRNMYIYTGKYQNKIITIATSGIGAPSMGIYAYELFKFYDVDCIIRIGSAGAYQKEINIYDIINVTAAYSESTFAKYATNFDGDIIKSSEDIRNIITKTAQKNKIDLNIGLIHSTDCFYRANSDEWKTNLKLKQCLAVEMEAFALFAVAMFFKKQAACILTISDSFITKEWITSDLREIGFNKMILLALDSARAYVQEREQ